MHKCQGDDASAKPHSQTQPGLGSADPVSFSCVIFSDYSISHEASVGLKQDTPPTNVELSPQENILGKEGIKRVEEGHLPAIKFHLAEKPQNVKLGVL